LLGFMIWWRGRRRVRLLGWVEVEWCVGNGVPKVPKKME
jgi:hypothetical protein